MDHRELGKQKFLIMGVVVLALMVSCPDSGQVELGAVSGLSPADGASTTDTTLTFSWDAVPDAAGYELQLADSKAGVEAAPTQSVTDTSYTPSSALATSKPTTGVCEQWMEMTRRGAGVRFTAWR